MTYWLSKPIGEKKNLVKFHKKAITFFLLRKMFLYFRTHLETLTNTIFVLHVSKSGFIAQTR